MPFTSEKLYAANLDTLDVDRNGAFFPLSIKKNNPECHAKLRNPPIMERSYPNTVGARNLCKALQTD